MKTASQKQSYDNYIEQKLQPAFGYSDEQLLAEYECTEAQPDDPDLIPPKDEWRKLLERINAAEEKKEEEHKVLRLKKVARPLILVAALGGVLLATGIGVSGTRGFEYLVRNLGGEGSGVVWNNNEDNLLGTKSEEWAYQRIQEELGINAIKLGYVPEGTIFKEVEIFHGQARLSFLHNEEVIQVFQTIYNVENSISTNSHSKSYGSVYNDWLKKEIPIKKNILENGKTEYGAGIEIGKAYYYITSIIDEDEFIKIVEMINYYE